jgi:hypothetical protein
VDLPVRDGDHDLENCGQELCLPPKDFVANPEPRFPPRKEVLHEDAIAREDTIVMLLSGCQLSAYRPFVWKDGAGACESF